MNKIKQNISPVSRLNTFSVAVLCFLLFTNTPRNRQDTWQENNLPPSLPKKNTILYIKTELPLQSSTPLEVYQTFRLLSCATWGPELPKLVFLLQTGVLSERLKGFKGVHFRVRAKPRTSTFETCQLQRYAQSMSP